MLAVEDGRAQLLRTHDLSPCAVLPDVGSGVVSCAAMREAGEARIEVVVGLESGQALTWSVDQRSLVVAGVVAPPAVGQELAPSDVAPETL